jgi:hypothetical protein
VTVSNVFPAGLSGCSTACVAAGGATCTAGPLAGNLFDVVSLPAGASVTHTAACLVVPGFTGQLVNLASADPGGANRGDARSPSSPRAGLDERRQVRERRVAGVRGQAVQGVRCRAHRQRCGVDGDRFGLRDPP